MAELAAASECLLQCWRATLLADGMLLSREIGLHHRDSPPSHETGRRSRQWQLSPAEDWPSSHRCTARASALVDGHLYPRFQHRPSAFYNLPHANDRVTTMGGTSARILAASPPRSVAKAATGGGVRRSRGSHRRHPACARPANGLLRHAARRPLRHSGGAGRRQCGAHYAFVAGEHIACGARPATCYRPPLPCSPSTRASVRTTTADSRLHPGTTTCNATPRRCG